MIRNLVDVLGAATGPAFVATVCMLGAFVLYVGGAAAVAVFSTDPKRRADARKVLNDLLGFLRGLLRRDDDASRK